MSPTATRRAILEVLRKEHATGSELGTRTSIARNLRSKLGVSVTQASAGLRALEQAGELERKGFVLFLGHQPGAESGHRSRKTSSGKTADAAKPRRVAKRSSLGAKRQSVAAADASSTISRPTTDSANDQDSRQAESIDAEIRQWERRAVEADVDEMAAYLQEHIGQQLTAYIAGLNDQKMVGKWAKGGINPSALSRERLRAAYHATGLFLLRYSDKAAQGWFFGANHYFDDDAPAAVLRTATTPDEISKVVPVARAFLRGAH